MQVLLSWIGQQAIEAGTHKEIFFYVFQRLSMYFKLFPICLI